MKKMIGTLTLLAASAGALMMPATAAAADRFYREPVRQERVVVRDVRVRPVHERRAWYDVRGYFGRDCR